ncbi:hypothetical protein [Streptomyces humi]
MSAPVAAAGVDDETERPDACVPRTTAGRTAWTAALVFLLCGMAHAPRHWGGAHPLALLVPGLCLLVAFALTIPAVRTAAAAAGLVGAAVLAAGPVLDARFGHRSGGFGAGLRRLSAVLDDAPVAPWTAGAVAAAAALAALAVLVVVLAGRRRAGRAPAQPTETGRSTR